MEGLTAGFGMGPGVPPPPGPLTRPGAPALAGGTLAASIARKASLIPFCDSMQSRVLRRARPISTARLSTSPCLQLRPIELLV